MGTTFYRLLEISGKEAGLLAAVCRVEADRRRFVVDPFEFKVVPGTPFAYWVSRGIRRLFSVDPALVAERRLVRKGISSADDPRFLRGSWEVSPELIGARWLPHAKGGEFSRYFSDLHMLVKWGHDPREIEASILAKYPYLGDNANWLLHREQPYGDPGLTWTYATTLPYSVRALPASSMFGDGGPSAFAPTEDLGWLLALLNCSVFGSLVNLSLGLAAEGRKNYAIGTVQAVPVPDLTPADEEALAKLARRAWSLKRSLDTKTETSHAFVLPALLQVSGVTLAARASAWAARVREADEVLAEIQAEIDERCFELYGISEEDRRSITEGFGSSPVVAEEGAEEADAEADEEEEAEAETADTASLAAELVSWAVGVAFGRFDVRLATGEREMPGEPEPFDPLPVCSPAMLTGTDGLPLDTPPLGYPLSFPSDGILVDDPGHTRDLIAAVRAVFEVVLGDRADVVWQEAGDLLDPKGHEVSNWLRSGFFEHHLRRHSKSRRKAPIVWQIGVPSGRYSIWTYAHRLTRDSLFAIGNDIAAPHLAHEERRLASLRIAAGDSPSARERAEIDAAETAVEEARTFLAEIRRVAPLWDPDLDDGIVLVSAPLWRLVLGHRPWQKELRSRWDDLAAGKYDWAHIAMHLWPERVVPKCASDRSLAIAHDLEDVFWVEGADGKWVKRLAPTRLIEDLIAERTSPAVKAALADLQGAPAPAGGGRGRGRSR